MKDVIYYILITVILLFTGCSSAYKKLKLVQFYSLECPACEIVKKNVEKAEKYYNSSVDFESHTILPPDYLKTLKMHSGEINDEIEYMRVRNAQDSKQLINEYTVKSVPYLIFFEYNKDGLKEYFRTGSIVDTKSIIEQFKKAGAMTNEEIKKISAENKAVKEQSSFITKIKDENTNSEEKSKIREDNK